jgi:hypothetical protein
MTLIWPIIVIAASPLMLQGTARGVVHGLMNGGIRFCAATLTIFAGLVLAFHVADSTFWRVVVIVAEVITIPITVPLYGIVVGIVTVPVVVVVMCDRERARIGGYFQLSNGLRVGPQR